MSSVLIAYSTVDGHTRVICERLRKQLAETGHAVTLTSLNDATEADLRRSGKVVLGASIRYGKHRPEVYRFIGRNKSLLEQKPSALFSVDLVSRKAGKDTVEGNPYLRRLTRRTRWQPRHAAVFAGKLDYRKYSARDRAIIRFIMWLTGGPTDPSACVEFTNWGQVRAFGERVAAM